MSVGAHGLLPLLSVFGDESGSFQAGDWQLIGIILTTDPQARRTELAALRDRYNFRRELKYSDTDVLSLPYALAVMDWFYRSDVKFHCIAKSGDTFDLGGFANNHLHLSAEELAYNYTYREVLAHNLPPGYRYIVTIDQRSRTKNNNLLTYLRREVVGVSDVLDGNSKKDDLLQVVDLLTGCVYGDLTSTKQARKRSLSDAFLRGCGRQTAMSPGPRTKANIWIYRGRKGTSPRQS